MTQRPVQGDGGTIDDTGPGGWQPAAIGAGCVAVGLWSATPLATKLAVVAFDPVAVGILRTGLAGLIALPLALLARMAPPRSRRGRTYLTVSALGGYLVFPLLFSIGQARTSAGHGAMILALTPIFTGLIAAALDRAMPRRSWWVGGAVAFAGTALLIGETLGFGSSEADFGGDLLVLAGSLSAACGYVAGARAAREAGTWPVTLWGITLASALLLPALPFFLSGSDLRMFQPDAWAAVFYLAVVSSIVAYGAWYWALAKGDIATMGTIQFAQPLAGLGLAAWILGEALTMPLALSAGLILLGVAVAQRANWSRPF